MRTSLHFGCSLNPSVNLSLNFINFRLLMQVQGHTKTSKNYWRSETVATSHGSLATVMCCTLFFQFLGSEEYLECSRKNTSHLNSYLPEFHIICMYSFSSPSFFFAALAACRSSWTRDRTCATAAIHAAAVLRPDP